MLGLGLIPGAGWRAREIQDVARAAEDAGFDSVFCTEVNNDAIPTAQLMGLATRRIRVGTWVAHTFLRLPDLCAKAAILAGDATDGRMILGLGVSHQPVNKALGIEMPDPSGHLRGYATEVIAWLRGRRTRNASSAAALACWGSCLSGGADLAEYRTCG
jgi:alkanesulfonate monooxygenase SsuD/methylene tetrahydromethanopterin reductase-like flavin-dependent oxidoreductase (luciferase family)